MLYYGMIRSYPERSFCLVSQQTQRKITGIACRGAAHPRHRADPELHHRPAPDERADGVPLRRGAAGGGHDVLLPRRGAGHVADGRARGRVHHQDAQGRHHADARLSAGLSHHHFRAGPAGARQSGAGRAEHGPHRHRGGRRGIVSLLRHAAYAALRPAQHDAGGLLHRGLCSRHVRAQGFPCRGVRLRRRDDRPDDRAVHHGDGRRRFRHPKR